MTVPGSFVDFLGGWVSNNELNNITQISEKKSIVLRTMEKMIRFIARFDHFYSGGDLGGFCFFCTGGGFGFSRSFLLESDSLCLSA